MMGGGAVSAANSHASQRRGAAPGLHVRGKGGDRGRVYAILDGRFNAGHTVSVPMLGKKTGYQS